MTNAQCDDAGKAICGAFLFVAFADAHYDEAEEGRFLATLANDPALAGVSACDLEQCYNETLALFRAGYARAAAEILKLVTDMRTNAATAAAVKLAARSAVVADERIEPQEEAALAHLATALGLEEGSL